MSYFLRIFNPPLLPPAFYSLHFFYLLLTTSAVSNSTFSPACIRCLCRLPTLYSLSSNFLFPQKFTLFPQNSFFSHFFTLFFRPPHSFSRNPHPFSSLLPSQGFRQLRGSRAAETHWFRWKEIDVLFTIAVTLLPQRTQLMADNYLGSQSRTGGGTIYFTRPFQVRDTRTTRGQHGPAIRQSRVRIPATD